MARFLEDLDLDGNAVTNAVIAVVNIPDLPQTIRDVPLDELELPVADLDLNDKKIVKLADGVAPTDGVNKQQLEAAIAGAVVDLATHSLSELGPPTADLLIGGFKLSDVADGALPTDAVNHGQMDAAIADLTTILDDKSLSDFDPAEADLDIGGFKLTNLVDGVAATDSVSKGQLDTAIGTVTSDLAGKALNDFAAPDGPVDLGNQQINNLADGTLPGDGVNKRQLDAAAMGIDWKNSVRVVATADVALSGLQTVDGKMLEDGQLVLCVGQTDGTENLGYIARPGPWDIAPQFTQGNLSSGAYVPVEESSTLGVKYRLATPDPIQVGTTDLDWQIADVATTYVGDGTTIDVTGGVISAITTKLARKLEGVLGDGALTLIPIAHNFGTKAVISQVWDIVTGETVNCGMLRTDNNVMTYRFANAPANASLGFAIQG